MSGAELLDVASAIAALARAAGATFIVNDRADIAALAGADGVHVGQDDLSPRHVRRVVGDTAIVGLSTHTLEHVDLALDEPISYFAIGPVFGTATKATGYDPIGLDRVAEAARRGRARGLPLVAIGGITLDRAPAVIEAGAASVAVISDLLDGGEPEARVRAYTERLSR
ncbi:MAG: thiamine phosphate synthase [Acidobacteriia bacterium]|nr:thiamine phosphate synthase [Terriglobia bacterium]